MQNFWLVLFDASGNPKGNFIMYLGHDEKSDPTNGLIAFGPLKTENIQQSSTVEAVVNGQEIGITAPGLKFLVGDIFRRVNDEEYRKLFGDDEYNAELAQIQTNDTRRIAQANWHPPKTLDYNDLPRVILPDDASEELRSVVSPLIDIPLVCTTFEAIARIERFHPGFTRAWRTRVKPKLWQEIHIFIAESLASLCDDLRDLQEGIKTKEQLDELNHLLVLNLTQMRSLLEVAKHFPSSGGITYEHFINMCDETESNIAQLSLKLKQDC